MTKFIPVSEPTITEKEVEYVMQDEFAKRVLQNIGTDGRRMASNFLLEGAKAFIRERITIWGKT
jgi:hypothetical protein